MLPPTVLIAWPLLRGQTFYHEDILYYFQALRGRLSAGLTGWNPWASAGLPLVGDGQLGAFNPLNLLYYFLEPSVAIPLTLLVMWCVASGLMVAYLHQLGLGPWPCAFGGLTWLWTGFFWHHLHHLTFLATAMWLPALLFSIARARERGGGAWGWVAASAAMTLLGGSPQLALYLGWLSLFYGAVLWRGASPTRLAALGGVWRVGLAWLVGVAASSVMLIPFLWAASERFVDAVGGLARSAQFSVHPLALIRALAPDLLGNPFHPGGYQGFSAYWEEGAYLGVVTLPLAAVGGMRHVSGRLGRLWSAVGGLSLLGMLGTLGGVHVLFYYVLPGYALFRAPGRLYMPLTFAVATLAAMGLDALSREPAVQGGGASPLGLRLGRAVKWLAVLGGELLLLGGVYLAMADEPGGNAAYALGVAVAALVASVVLLTFYGRGRLAPGGLAVAATALLLLEVLATAAPFNLPVPRSVADTPSALETWLGEASAHAGQRYRVLVDDTAPPRYLNAGMEAGYLGLRGYNPLNSKRLIGFLAASGSGPVGSGQGGIVAQISLMTSPLLDLLAARWWVTTQNQADLPTHLLPVWEGDGGLRVLENPRALPRAYLAGAPQVVRGATAMGDAIRKAALMRPPPLIVDGADADLIVCERCLGGEGAGEILGFVDAVDRVQIDVDVARPVYVVLADTWAPGWRAEVDGEPAPIVKAYGAARAVALTQPGLSRVAFIYTPPGLPLAVGLTVFGWVLIGGMIWVDRRRSVGLS